jgi:hypothetical protein
MALAYTGSTAFLCAGADTVIWTLVDAVSANGLLLFPFIIEDYFVKASRIYRGVSKSLDER